MSEESKVGRPSKYKPEYCEQLIKHMSDGLSFESFAAVIDVNQDTLHEWAKVHPEFSEAKKEAYSRNLLFWEKQGIHGLYSSKDSSFNATVWIFNMKNRHKWRDKQADEAEVVINNNNSNVTKISDEDLESKINEKLEKLKPKGEE